MNFWQLSAHSERLTLGVKVKDGLFMTRNRGPRATHQRPSSSGGTFGGVVCELSEPKKKAKYAPPPILHSRC